MADYDNAHKLITLQQFDTYLGRVDRDKADKKEKKPITIPTTAASWKSDTTAVYPKYYDYAVAGITVADRVDIAIAPASASAAKSCGLCPTSETLAGVIRIRSVSVPTAEITGEYWIEDGKE